MRLDAYKWEQAKPAAGLPLTRPSEIGLKVRRLGLQDYVPLWQAMRYLAEHPRQGRDDEIWMPGPPGTGVFIQLKLPLESACNI